MNFKMWLENIVNNPDGSISIPNPDAITMDQWQKINNYLVRKGYDLRGAEDAKARLGRWKRYDGDHAAAIRFALGQTPEGMPKPPRVRTPDQKMLTRIVKHFGTTNNFRSAGFILADGRLLNLASQDSMRWGDTKRDLDHNEIGQFLSNPDDAKRLGPVMLFGTQYGAIRIGSTDSATHVDIYKEPTPQQYKILYQLFDRSPEAIRVEIQIGGGNFMKDYPQEDQFGRPSEVKPPTYKIIQDIKDYFRK